MGEDWMLQPAGIPWSNWLAIELMSRWYEGTRERARLGDAAPAGRDP